MKKEMEEQKERLKGQITSEIDSYYEELTQGLERQTIRIDDVERMLVEKQKKIKELITEATGETFAETEASIEKNDVRSAEDLCENKAARKE